MMIRTFHHSTLGLALNCWRLCNINKQRFESRKTHAYHTRHVVSKCNWEGGSKRACYREVSTRSVCTGHLYLAVSAPGAADTARRPTGPSAPSGGDSGEGPHLRAYSCSAAPPPNSSESRRAAVAPPATTYLRAPLSAPLSALLLYCSPTADWLVPPRSTLYNRLCTNLNYYRFTFLFTRYVHSRAEKWTFSF